MPLAITAQEITVPEIIAQETTAQGITAQGTAAQGTAAQGTTAQGTTARAITVLATVAPVIDVKSKNYLICEAWCLKLVLIKHYTSESAEFEELLRSLLFEG